MLWRAMGVSSDPGWKSFSDHLDRILDLSEPDACRYLANLEKTDAATASRLNALLRARDHRGYAAFLTGSPL